MLEMSWVKWEKKELYRKVGAAAQKYQNYNRIFTHFDWIDRGDQMNMINWH